MSDFDSDKPFNNLPDLPPARELETKAVLKKCISARSTLAAMNQQNQQLPSSAILISTLPVLEAQASSEIENIITTTDELFKQIGRNQKGADPATKEALRYREALIEGYSAIIKKPLGTNIACDICSKIKNTDMDIRRVPGTQLKNDLTGETIYTPPVGEARLRQLLANWETYLHTEDDIDPLVKLAVTHYQFEAIHPFTDGNDRTGRILNILFLIEKGLLDTPILYLSGYIIGHKEEYYAAIDAVTKKQDWENWILFMLNAVEETASWAKDKINAILKLSEETKSHVKSLSPELYSHEMMDTIFANPYCAISDITGTGIAKRQTASKYLKRLCEIQVLKEYKNGREKIFANTRLIQLLNSKEHKYTPFVGG